jgi:hypothetical protein
MTFNALLIIILKISFIAYTSNRWIVFSIIELFTWTTINNFLFFKSITNQAADVRIFNRKFYKFVKKFHKKNFFSILNYSMESYLS